MQRSWRGQPSALSSCPFSAFYRRSRQEIDLSGCISFPLPFLGFFTFVKLLSKVLRSFCLKILAVIAAVFCAMSDPPSIAAGVVGIITAAAQIFSLLIKFTRQSNSAPRLAGIVLTEGAETSGVFPPAIVLA